MKPFSYISLNAGIGSEIVAWEPLGWELRAIKNEDRFANAVILNTCANQNNLKIHQGKSFTFEFYEREATTLVFSRAKIEPFSIAEFGNLLHVTSDNPALALLAGIKRLAPRWVVWEGVTGTLLDEARAFETLIQGLAKLGHGFAYRVLDAQHFGSPQRHRRVYLVAHAGGGWQRCAAVLFDPESLHRDCQAGGEETDEDPLDADLGVIQTGGDTQTFCPRLAAALRPGAASRSSHSKLTGGTSRTTLIVEQSPKLPHGVGVRRLTPLEYERVMGLPDNYTFVPINLYEPPPTETLVDLRYKAVGGSVPVGVLRWIGERIKIVDAI